MSSYILGVMQGRLLSKYQGRYQAHPVGYWKDEFTIAKDLKLDCIEFILDFNEYESNPLLTDHGLKEIQKVSNKTGVKINTICADYFMEAPIHSSNKKVANASVKVLINLIRNSHQLGVTDIVIPCVDQSSLNEKAKIARFISEMEPCVDEAEKFKINLSLETDMPPQEFLKLINSFQSDNVTVNYDIGNSASLGYNMEEELELYGHKITDIHIKDRIYNGGPVILGTGSADFSKFFQKLKEYNYKGPLIMQAYRDDEGLNIFKKQLDWIMPFIKK